jgi:hypothetical protein
MVRNLSSGLERFSFALVSAGGPTEALPEARGWIGLGVQAHRGDRWVVVLCLFLYFLTVTVSLSYALSLFLLATKRAHIAWIFFAHDMSRTLHV